MAFDLRGGLALLLDLGLLAAQFAQVVQLGPADIAAGDDLDVVDHRRVHGEGALHADLEADLADREGLAHALTGAADDDALEDLDAGAVAFDDVHVHLDGVTGTEVRNIGPEGSSIDGVENVHGRFALCARHGSDAVVFGKKRSGALAKIPAPLWQSPPGTNVHHARDRRTS